MLPASSLFQPVPVQSAQPLAGQRLQALPGRAMQGMQGKMLQYGIDSGPLSELAITAVDATVHGNRMRDVSVMANRLDKASKAKLSKVEMRVLLIVLGGHDLDSALLLRLEHVEL